MGLHTMTDHSISEKIEYKYLSFINKVFLVVHIGFLLLFANLKINFMVYFNLGSILFYTLAFFMLQKFKIHLYVYLASIEILLHMSAATLCVGLGCNFQLCLFGVILFFFIIECILPDKKKSITPVLILSSLYSCHRLLQNIRSGFGSSLRCVAGEQYGYSKMRYPKIIRCSPRHYVNLPIK